MKTLTKTLFTLIALLSFSFAAQAQKTVSAGIKAGFPNLVGGTVEVAIPVLGNHFSVYGDLSSFKEVDLSEAFDEEVTANFKYKEYGVNFYLGPSSMKGLYVGAGVGDFALDLSLTNILLDNGATGSASTELAFNTTNFKVGVKTGGMFYVRLEAGLGFGDIPTEITVVARSSDGYTETITESFEQDLKDIPGFSANGIGILNFGVGLAF